MITEIFRDVVTSGYMAIKNGCSADEFAPYQAATRSSGSRGKNLNALSDVAVSTAGQPRQAHVRVARCRASRA
jgi:hypothetical protein